MRLRPRARCLLIGGLLGAGLSQLTLGEARACSAPLHVEADAEVLALWPELPDELRDSLAQRSEIDHCARVRLSLANQSILLAVTLRDGRSALRSVPAREDVLPMLEALLLVPRHEGAPRETRPAPERLTLAPVAPTRAQTRAGPAGDDGGGKVADASGRIGFEAAAITSARFGDEQFGFSLGLLSLLEVHAWLLGFQARAVNYEQSAPAPAPPRSTFEFAGLAGYRLHFGTLALDFIAGPAFVYEGREEEIVGPAGEFRQTSSGVTTRFAFGSHLNFASTSVLRGFVGIDGEVGDSGPPNSLDQTAALPRWMLGLALGATLGTR